MDSRRRSVGYAILAGAALLVLAGCTAGARSGATADAHVGADNCGACHQGESRTWKDAYQARMVRPASEALLPEAIDHWVRDGKGNAGPTTGNIDGKTYALADVQMVVGSKWKQRYLVKNPATGFHQFLDKQWNSYTRLWEDYGQKQAWESLCTTCHSPEYQMVGLELPAGRGTQSAQSR